MKIAFFGLPLAAVLLARDGHTIVYAAASAAAPGLRRLARRIAPGRTDLKPGAADAATLRRVHHAAPDLIVSWFWTTKLPPSVLALAPAVGVHPSLLPRHRGADPYFWAIDAGDTVTGVTAHLLDAEYDTGAILARRELPIAPRWNAWQLARALDRPSLALLRDVVRAYAGGHPPEPQPQDEGDATNAPEPRDEDLALRWSWPSSRICTRVRAASPWPGAWTEINDRIVTLVGVRPTRDFPRVLEPGEAMVRPDGRAVVRTGDAAVELLEGRDEDDRPLSWAELADLVREAARTETFQGR
jgi:methionyl-tRNA formyltransferase